MSGDEEPARHWELLARFGLPRLARDEVAEASPSPSGDLQSAWSPSSETGLLFATVTTENQLALAVTAIRSFEQHHPEAGVLLMLVDAAGTPNGLDPRWTVITPTDIDVPNFGFLALKYDADELCCAMKPFLVLAGLRMSDRVVYADANVLFFARCDALLRQLEAHDFVVTPHTTAPLPNPERFWERPTMGDLARSGPFNTGVFGVRSGNQVQGFLKTWAQLVTEPGAFSREFGPQSEQNSFNWVTCFVDDVHVLRDASYNVAYWNLHDRSLRWRGLDNAGLGLEWLVDGAPLVSFNYSGYDASVQGRLSRHDHRYLVNDLPSVAALLDHLESLLREHGHEEHRGREYRFARLPNGVPLDLDVRNVLKRYERTLVLPSNPWSRAGSDALASILMSAHSGAGSLLPMIFVDVYERRADLRSAFPGSHLEPSRMFEWIARYGAGEHGKDILFANHRRVLGTLCLAQVVQQGIAKALSFGPQALSSSRLEFADTLGEAGHSFEANAVRNCSAEIYYATPLFSALAIHDAREDLQEAFPDPLGADSETYAEWLLQHGTREYNIPAAAPEALRARANGGALVRIFSFLKRSDEVVSRFPRALIGEAWRGLARELLGLSGEGLDFDLEDVVAFIWIAQRSPAKGLPFLLELPRHRRARRSPRTLEGALAICGDRMSDSAFAQEFRRYQKLFDPAHLVLEEAYYAALIEEEPAEVTPGEGKGAKPRSARLYAAAKPAARAAAGQLGLRVEKDWWDSRAGLNLFGYFGSPIGLGQSSWGLSRALNAANVSCARQLVTNVSMRPDLKLEDLVERFRYDFDTNVFVSFPHAHTSIFDHYPAAYTAGRRNIAHLAWEQRDRNPLWKRNFDRFDQIWAISSFAAEPLRELFGERVKIVPNVVDASSFPPPVDKAAVGLRHDRFTFLFIFDANSSIERKNPEATVEAFRKAFQGSAQAADVELILKVGHAGRREHALRLRQLMTAASQTDLRIKFMTEALSREDLLRLISAVDCYVSLHRSEGFGYTCAEAMTYGKPVIATAYSGNLEFMTPENSLLVPAREALVAKAEGPFQRGSVWAEPDTSLAAEMMRKVYADASFRKAIGRAASHSVAASLSAKTIGARMAAYLSE